MQLLRVMPCVQPAANASCDPRLRAAPPEYFDLIFDDKCLQYLLAFGRYVIQLDVNTVREIQLFCTTYMIEISVYTVQPCFASLHVLTNVVLSLLRPWLTEIDEILLNLLLNGLHVVDKMYYVVVDTHDLAPWRRP